MVKIYVVERVQEDKHGTEVWSKIIGIFKDKANAAIFYSEESDRFPTLKCKMRVVETDLVG